MYRVILLSRRRTRPEKVISIIVGERTTPPCPLLSVATKRKQPYIIRDGGRDLLREFALEKCVVRPQGYIHIYN